MMKSIKITVLILAGVLLLMTGCNTSPQTQGTDTETPSGHNELTDGTVGISDDTETESPADIRPSDETAESESDNGRETEENGESETAGTVSALTPEEIADLLNGTDYTLDQLAGATGIGLSDASNVGLIERDLNATLYPVPDDSTFRRTITVTEYGLSPENPDNGPAFRRMMNDLSTEVGRIKVVFPVGVYRFATTLSFNSLSRIYVCSDTPGTQFEILMTEWTRGITVSDCSDITLVDFSLDYEIPSAVTGTIVSFDTQKKQAVIRIDDEFDLSHPNYQGGYVRYGNYMELLRDETTGKYYPNVKGNLLYNSTGDGLNAITAGSYDASTKQLTLTFSGTVTKPQAGTVVNVAFTMYENHGLYADSCKNIRLENARFYHTTGMAIGMTKCTGVYLNRVVLSPREGSARYMTATADGLHCLSCFGEITVTNSVFENSHDDCVNVNGRFFETVSVRDKDFTVSSLPEPLSVGDQLEFYSKKDLHYVGKVTVTKIQDKTVYADGITSDMGNCFACNITTAPKVTFKNCFFGNKRNRGILIQEPDTVIENCVFKNICHGPIQIFSVPSSFGEGIMPKRVVVRNCKFCDNYGQDVDVFSWAADGTTSSEVICDVTVTNNYFHGSNSHSIQVSTGKNVIISDNLFDDVIRRASVSPRCIVKVSSSTDVAVFDNAAVNCITKVSFANDKNVERDKKSTNVSFTNNVFLN